MVSVARRLCAEPASRDRPMAPPGSDLRRARGRVRSLRREVSGACSVRTDEEAEEARHRRFASGWFQRLFPSD
jgi:hypothetical protein